MWVNLWLGFIRERLQPSFTYCIRIIYLNMIFKLILTFFLFTILNFSLMSQFNLSKEQLDEDFNYLWNNIHEHYAYFGMKRTDWNMVKEIYNPQIKNVDSKEKLMKFFESILEELYDNHTTLNKNNTHSPRLMPSGLCVWAEWLNGKAIITDIKSELISNVDFTPGSEIISINDIPITEAVNSHIGKSIKNIDDEVRNWALRRVLAGTYDEARIIKILSGNKEFNVDLDLLDKEINERITKDLLTTTIIEDNIGYIRINNSLGNDSLIGIFDSTILFLKSTSSLILDLRNTPGGGNSLVARAIMGRFIHEDKPYQKHMFYESDYKIKRTFVEYVSPREGFIYDKPVAVLVNHWTGSMGEGITIGFDAMSRVSVIGTKMAGLLGAINNITLPNSQIGVNFPTEMLFHINGTPREEYVPKVFIDINDFNEDVILNKAISKLK